MAKDCIKRVIGVSTIMALATGCVWADTASGAEMAQMRMIVLVGAVVALGVVVMGFRAFLESRRNAAGSDRGKVTPFRSSHKK